MEYYNFGSINTSIYTRKDDYYKKIEMMKEIIEYIS